MKFYKFPLLILSYFFISLISCSPKSSIKVGDDTLIDRSIGVEEAIDKAKKNLDIRKNPPKPSPAKPINIGSAETFQLDNGLKVIVVENNKLPRLSMEVIVDVPVIDESDKVGLAQIAGELLKTGTINLSKIEIDEQIDFIGASLNSDATGISVSGLSKHKDVMFKIVQDVLLNPVFDQTQFDKIIKQTLSRITQSQSDAGQISRNIGSTLIYGKDHPYGKFATKESINNISVQDCKNYYDAYFQPQISYLVIVGDIDLESAIEISQIYFSSWAASKKILENIFPNPEPNDDLKVNFVNKKDAVQSVISISYPVDLRPDSDDLIKARVANTIFGGYFRSRLNDNLREKKAYTYGARSRLTSDELLGEFSANASVRNEVTDSAIVQFLHEMERMRSSRVSLSELSIVKSVLAGSFGRSLENPSTLARFAFNVEKYNLPKNYYETYLERLDNVSVDDVIAMSQKYINPKRANLLIVGNRESVFDKLKQFSKSGQIDQYKFNGDKITIPNSNSNEKK